MILAYWLGVKDSVDIVKHSLQQAPHVLVPTPTDEQNGPPQLLKTDRNIPRLLHALCNSSIRLGESMGLSRGEGGAEGFNWVAEML